MSRDCVYWMAPADDHAAVVAGHLCTAGAAPMFTRMPGGMSLWFSQRGSKGSGCPVQVQTSRSSVATAATTYAAASNPDRTALRSGHRAASPTTTPTPPPPATAVIWTGNRGFCRRSHPAAPAHASSVARWHHRSQRGTTGRQCRPMPTHTASTRMVATAGNPAATAATAGITANAAAAGSTLPSAGGLLAAGSSSRGSLTSASIGPYKKNGGFGPV